MGKVITAYPSNKAKPGNRLVTIEDLQNFKTEILLSFKAIVNGADQPASPKWLKSYQVKQILDISKGTLQRLRSNGTLPFTKMGGILYYEAEEVNRVLSSGKRDFKKGIIAPLRSQVAK